MRGAQVGSPLNWDSSCGWSRMLRGGFGESVRWHKTTRQWWKWTGVHSQCILQAELKEPGDDLDVQDEGK